MAIIVPRARRFFWSRAEWLRNEKAEWLFQDSETRSWLSKFALRGYFGDSTASFTVTMNSPIHHFDTRLSFVMILYHAKRKAQKWKLLWSLRMKANKIIQRRIINGTERETLRYSLWDMWISLKLFLNQLNAWINRKLVSGEVRNFGQCCQERTQQSPVHYIDYFASRQTRENLMTFQIIDWNLGMSHESDSV